VTNDNVVRPDFQGDEVSAQVAGVLESMGALLREKTVRGLAVVILARDENELAVYHCNTHVSDDDAMLRDGIEKMIFDMQMDRYQMPEPDE